MTEWWIIAVSYTTWGERKAAPLSLRTRKKGKGNGTFYLQKYPVLLKCTVLSVNFVMLVLVGNSMVLVRKCKTKKAVCVNWWKQNDNNFQVKSTANQLVMPASMKLRQLHEESKPFLSYFYGTVTRYYTRDWQFPKLVQKNNFSWLTSIYATQLVLCTSESS